MDDPTLGRFVGNISEKENTMGLTAKGRKGTSLGYVWRTPVAKRLRSRYGFPLIWVVHPIDFARLMLRTKTLSLVGITSKTLENPFTVSFLLAFDSPKRRSANIKRAVQNTIEEPAD
jgi:hypothetical protein